MLLLIMLMGLLRMRLETGDVLGLGRLLWKQVRWWQFLAVCDTPNSPMCISICQGLLWLLIATIAEVPSTVRLAIPLHSSLLLIATSRRRCS